MNTNRFFQLLNELQVELEENQSVNLLDPTLLESRLQELYAEPNPTPEGTPFVELLTIHKAKGLEWDVVLVPALERQPAADRSRLLTWSELEPSDSSDDASAHFMLAPIAGRGEPSKALNNWLNGIHRAREAAERKRLFYVACTRARQELHLFAAPSRLLQWRDPSPLHQPAASCLARRRGPLLPHRESGCPDGVPGERSLLAGVARLDLRPGFVPQIFVSSIPPTSSTWPPPHPPLSNAFPSTSTPPRASPPPAPTGCPTAIPTTPPLPARPRSPVPKARLPRAPSAMSSTPPWKPSPAASPPAAHPLRCSPNSPPGLRASPRCCAPTDLPTPPSTASPARPAQPWKTLCATLTASGCLPPTPPPPASSPSPHGPSLITRTVNPPFAPLPSASTASSAPGPNPTPPAKTSSGSLTTRPPAHGAAGLDDFLAAQRAAYAPQLETYARILTQLPHPADRPAPKEVRLALYYPTLPRLLWWPLANPPA